MSAFSCDRLSRSRTAREIGHVMVMMTMMMIINQELATKCELWNGPPIPQSVFKTSHSHMYCGRPTVTDRTVRNYRPTRVMPDKPMQEAHSVHAAIRNSLHFHNTITDRLHKYTDFKEVLITVWQLNTVYITPIVLSSVDIIARTLQYSLYCLISALL